MSEPLSRRTVLRGLGAAVSLPWLEAMSPRARAAEKAKPPLRVAFIYVPNGIVMRNWTPMEAGKLPEKLPPVLEPLAKLRDDFSIISGLASDKGRAGVGHAPAQVAFITCARPRKTQGSDFRAGVSVDQVAAGRLRDQTRLPSLQIGCDGAMLTGGCDDYACPYMSTLSWRDATTPLPQITNPRHVFDRLFATDAGRSAQREAERRSVLDFVREEARGLQTDLGTTDRRKLDEYFTAIRDIEQRVERAARIPASAPPKDFTAPEAKPRKELTWAEHARLLGDLMVLAFQTDTTRVCSFVFRNEFSGSSYAYADIPDSHHHVSHHGNDAVKTAGCTAINKHMVEQLGYILGKLKAEKEGEGTLLDNCMLAYGSGISDGMTHSKSDLPILLAGRAGGALKQGRHLRYEKETPLANLWLSMLDVMGAKVERFGDSTGRLSGL